MRVLLLYFASLKERAATPQDALELPEGATLRDAVERAGQLHPSLLPLGPSVRCAKNAELSSLDAALADGDEVALLPPVSGG